jgi:hypothetical protein
MQGALGLPVHAGTREAVPGDTSKQSVRVALDFTSAPIHLDLAMEVIVAFGLAANVLQVVEYAHKLLSAGRQIHQDGSTVGNDELECTVKDFTVLNNRLKTSIRASPGTMDLLIEDGRVRTAQIQLMCASNLIANRVWKAWRASAKRLPQIY